MSKSPRSEAKQAEAWPLVQDELVPKPSDDKEEKMELQGTGKDDDDILHDEISEAERERAMERAMGEIQKMREASTWEKKSMSPHKAQWALEGGGFGRADSDSS
jgi:hypothetical protein